MESLTYIERRGAIVCAIPVAIDGVQAEACPMPFQFPLQAGDTLQVLANTAANRTFAYSVITGQNVHAIFSGTPSGAGNTDLTHILSGQSIGQSLTGQRVISQMATSVDGSKLSTGGVLCLNDRGYLLVVYLLLSHKICNQSTRVWAVSLLILTL